MEAELSSDWHLSPQEMADAPRMAVLKGHLDSVISMDLFQLNHSVLFYLIRRHLSGRSDAAMIEFSFAVLIVAVWLSICSLKSGYVLNSRSSVDTCGTY